MLKEKIETLLGYGKSKLNNKGFKVNIFYYKDGLWQLEVELKQQTIIFFVDTENQKIGSDVVNNDTITINKVIFPTKTQKLTKNSINKFVKYCVDNYEI